MHLPSKILVATDFGDSAAHALDSAVELAGKLGAQVYLLHVIVVPTMGLPEIGIAISSTAMESTVLAAQAQLDRLAARYPDAGIITELATGDPRDAIASLARATGVDLIVVGSHGRRGIRRALLGSVAEDVVRIAPCPVLTIRAPAAPAARAA